MNSKATKGRALITGASTGIGATYADRLAARGHDLVLVARDAARLEQVAAGIRSQYGVQVEVFPADLTSKYELLRVEQRLRADDTITVLVNNAGMAVQGKLIDADIDRYETMIQLNVISVTRLAAAAAATFGKRGSGDIINVASVLALAPEMFNGTYSGTKAYVLNLSQSMQAELGPLGVRVQAVLPGATRTEIWERSGGSIAQLPPEMLMEVDDMVDAALAGLDMGEGVTIPSLPDVADWNALTAARHALGPNLSRNHPAQRYLTHAG
ncbi:SDR family oxidoreductase [Herbaspirillum sp. LeCh32-8]|uniref:SDR family NAD(P)-dependent oxidoreductase n=1 Tax=Herbaspirillum sp. LeCh32-8 TaxID=2821356 RepID=UPI001AEB2B24|nr:SDR family oxidoreductase [Herbaspirillum sp. LeCh32-8]MBP0598179.1 SDR family oxidoreductase [Herbaspirillum sp. LeCh32-8]